MSKVGRRRSVVWECFKDHPEPGKRRVLCRFCEHDTVANPTRMVRHIVKYCPQAGEEHKRICREYESLTVPARRRESVGSVGGGASTGGSPSRQSPAAARNASLTVTASNGVAVTTESVAVAVDGSEYTYADHQQRRHSLGASAESGSGLQAQPPLRVSFQAQLQQQLQQQQQLLPLVNVTPSSNRPLAQPRVRAESSARSAQTRRSIDSYSVTPAPPSSPSSAAALAPSVTEKIQEELVLALLSQSDATDSHLNQLALLENDHFKHVLRLLRPEFHVPTVKAVRQSVLPKLHTEARTAIEKFVKSASSLTVLCSTEIVTDNKRTLRWFAVDQESRCELLGVAPHVGTEYPEEIAARIRAFIAQQIPRPVVPGYHNQQPFMLHFCNDSLGGAQLARRLLIKKPSSGAASGSASSSSNLPMLVGGCMMQQTLLLFRDTLESVTCVGLALEKCMEVASFIRCCKPLQRDLKTAAVAMDQHQTQHHYQFDIQAPTPESFHSFIVCVNQVLALKGVIQRVLTSYTAIGSETLTAPYLNAGTRARVFIDVVGDEMFWLCLEYTREVLEPFAHALVLSDAGHATSSQLLLCWLMLQHTVNGSSLVLESDKESFNMLLVDRIRMFSEDHVFACLLVDPRVHGLSLSAHGKRKARLIIADLGAKLSPSGTLNRSRLLGQLLKFLNRERPFEDNDSWTMMQWMPRLFWLEYLEEMPELATVALAVLGFHSHLMPLEETWQTCVQRHRRRRQSGISSSSQDLASDALLLELEQVKFHYRKEPRSGEDARIQSLLKYRKCLPMGNNISEGAVLASLFGDDSVDEALGSSTVSATRPPTSDRLRSDSVASLELSDNGDDENSTQPPKKAADEASLALRQFKFWLQRLDEQEKNVAVRGDDSTSPDGSLQRFDAEWLDLSAECAQRVRLCVEKFVFGHEEEEENEDAGDDETQSDDGSGSGTSEAGGKNPEQQQQRGSSGGRNEGSRTGGDQGDAMSG